MRYALALVVVLRSGIAHADGPLGPNGSDIRTSDYAVDLASGPVVAGPRVIGLGGAYVAIAEGVDGNPQNPAAPAVRAAWSSSHVDYDVTLGLVFPSTLSRTDYFNTGRGRTDLRRSDQREFTLLAPAGNLQIGSWGVGLGLDLQRYGLLRRRDLSTGRQEEPIRAQISTLHTYLARAVDDGQLVAGLGLHVTALDVTTRDEVFTREGNLFTSRGVSLEGGFVWRPSNERYRVGFALRAPVTTDVDSRGRTVGGDIVLRDPSSPDAIWMPKRVKRPWSTDVGVAVQLGPRPLNVPWLDPARLRGWDEQADQLKQRLHDRYANMPRRYVLISAALRADGDVAHSVGIESFLQGKVDRSGERVALSPRLGVETEAIERWLKVRVGSYREPSRFRGTDARYHATAGFDVRLFSTSLFGLLDDDASLALSAAGDRARDYFGWAVALGVWR